MSGLKDIVIRTHLPLAPFTTLRIGGPARFFVEARSDGDAQAALALARERGLPLFILGGGSNVLVPDAGVAGVVMKMATERVAFDERAALVVADAGTPWDAVVDAAALRGWWGIENLAGIPGTAGGAAVQNIGAYGAELADVFAYADVLDAATGAPERVLRADAAFGYRTSVFKKRRGLVITRVALALALARDGRPNLSYPDLARGRAAGAPLRTPAAVASAVRAVRAGKFPPDGSAGSFFKNPVLAPPEAAALAARYPGLPQFPQDGGVKVSLAWLLDNALALKGFSVGRARLYERQPLVIAAAEGATAAEVDALARAVAQRVKNTLGIALEREVEYVGQVEVQRDAQ